MKRFEINGIKIRKNAEGFYDVYVGEQVLMEMLGESEVKSLTIGQIEQCMKDAGDFQYGGYSGIQELLEDLEAEGHEIYDYSFFDDGEEEGTTITIDMDPDGWHCTEVIAKAYPDGTLYIDRKYKVDY